MALISDLGVDGGGILHPQHKNRWALSFIGIGGLSNANGLRLQAITADRPKLEFEKITLDRYNSRAYLAGKHTWQPISITFEVDIGGEVHDVVQRQLENQQHILANSGALRLPAAASGDLYKFGITMDMLDGDNIILESWKIDGCYLENVDWGDVDYAASETVKTVCTVSYDHARQVITGIRGNATGGEAV